MVNKPKRGINGNFKILKQFLKEGKCENEPPKKMK